MRVCLTIASLIMLACGEDIQSNADVSSDLRDLGVDASTNGGTCQDVWVCWNPSSSTHGGRCTEDCYVPGDNTKFCYLTSECTQKIDLQSN